jgi:hypothetical protein
MTGAPRSAWRFLRERSLRCNTLLRLTIHPEFTLGVLVEGTATAVRALKQIGMVLPCPRIWACSAIHPEE